MDLDARFDAYAELLLKENDKQNLISRRAGREEIKSHIRDSLALTGFIPLEDETLVDLGSGAGFPGLMLAIACPRLEVTLLESDLKKCDFLSRCAGELDLSRVTVLRERAEVIGQSSAWRGHFDLCTSRAVAAARVLLEYGLPLLKEGGRQLMWKSSGWQQEMSEAQNALTVLGGRYDTIWNYDLTGDKDRCIIAVRKTAPTPDAYPRRTGVPSKRPL
ncbi:MAG: 16S rRNA (guanine(527)-N(7))-methyltransferase RsmG [Syntrophomonadaceae bacterium]|nr:16S rRNA (guanine(527)-N(7))-methyltransferase RsmG [Syntrophomonadaceae bacterium]